MIATFFLFMHFVIMGGQYFIDGRRFEIFDPKNLFQIYLVIQLPFILFIGVNFDVPGFIVLSRTTHVDDILSLAIIFILAHISFLMANYSIRGKILRLQIINGLKWNYQRVKVLCVLIFIFSYVMVFYLFEINGGYVNFIESREAWRAGGMVGQGWILFPATTLLALAAIAFVIVRRQTFTRKFGLVKLFLLIGLAVLPASQLGFRGLMLLPALQILFVYHFRIKKFEFKKIFPLLFSLIFLFTFYGIYRESYYLMPDGFNISMAMEFIADKPEFLFSIFLRSKGADIISSVINQLHNLSDYSYFFPALFEVLTIPIPSALWAGKPIPQGVIFSEKFFGISGGVSTTVVGEAYWQAGIFGVLIIMIVLGVIFRLFINSVRRYSSNDSVLFLSAAVFPSLIMMAESVQNYMNGIVLIIVFSSFLLFIFSIRLGYSSGRASSFSPI
jgi:oligosaccharide repeat unit polymerase